MFLLAQSILVSQSVRYRARLLALFHALGLQVYGKPVFTLF